MRSCKTVSCSVTGYRKQLSHAPCEDATKVLHVKGGTIIAVADGHGDKRCLFASVGAQLAVRAACEVLKRHLKTVKHHAAEYWNSVRDRVAGEIAQRFAQLVLEDYGFRCPNQVTLSELTALQYHVATYFQERDQAYTPDRLREIYMERKQLGDRVGKILYLYGTTIRAVVLTDAYLFNCALGDGDSLAVIGDRVEWLLPQANAYECETESLCEPMETVVRSFDFSFVELQPSSARGDRISDVHLEVSAVILATDGLRNSFLSDALFTAKIREITDALCSGKRSVTAAHLKALYRKLSMESVFQDDISTVIAVRLPSAGQCEETSGECSEANVSENG